jgi:hypothetical protein
VVRLREALTSISQALAVPARISVLSVDPLAIPVMCYWEQLGITSIPLPQSKIRLLECLSRCQPA